MKPSLSRLSSLSFLGVFCAAGCSDRPVTTPTPNETSYKVARLVQSSIDQIDILIDVDNSRSMADKQQILAEAVPDLVRGLVNPPCVDAAGAPTPSQPSGPLDPCPLGARRRIKPFTDIHIGVITSSLGGHGGDACPKMESNTCASGSNYSNNDQAHLLSRKDPCGSEVVPTYGGKGFLAWDPKQTSAPPGEIDLDVDTNGDGRALLPDLRDMVLGAGQIGCGYEATLESWYRFLVDPEPYATIEVVNNTATPMGVDSVLLQQRADFLRPGSLLSILLLSDENDCSIKDSSQYFFAAQLKDGNGTPFQLPRPRSECAVDPNDPCCKSCGQGAGDCPVDPSCKDGNGDTKALTQVEDPSNLRCFDQKRRFGIDFLYPIERYAQALTSPTVVNRAGELVPNPLFSDLDPNDEHRNVRDSSLIFLTAIVGVPWQAIARDPKDLTKGFLTPWEMAATDANGDSVWDKILGDPPNDVPPLDPHMIEQIDPRAGLAPPGSPDLPDPAADPIHGHEYTPSLARDDLQYACVFPLPQPRDCAAPGVIACDCTDGQNDNPLCEATDPANPKTTRTLQTRAKAYPGLREIALVKALDGQGTVGSVCPKQQNDTASADFGYRPAIEGLLNRLTPTADGQCLPTPISVDAAGQAECIFVEVTNAPAGQEAACNACADPGRQAVTADKSGVINLIKADPIYPSALWNCFCELKQASGADLAACQGDVTDVPLNADTSKPAQGWCYIDAMSSPPVGNPELVKQCPDTERRNFRYLGESSPKNGVTLFLACKK